MSDAETPGKGWWIQLRKEDLIQICVIEKKYTRPVQKESEKRESINDAQMSWSGEDSTAFQDQRSAMKGMFLSRTKKGETLH